VHSEGVSSRCLPSSSVVICRCFFNSRGMFPGSGHGEVVRLVPYLVTTRSIVRRMPYEPIFPQVTSFIVLWKRFTFFFFLASPHRCDPVMEIALFGFRELSLSPPSFPRHSPLLSSVLRDLRGRVVFKHARSDLSFLLSQQHYVVFPSVCVSANTFRSPRLRPLASHTCPPPGTFPPFLLSTSRCD